MNDQPPLSRRERRIASRRQAIMEAAASVFAEKGFHRTTTKDIAEAADVSEGTIYNYFEDKEHLVMGIMAYLVEAEQSATRQADSLPEDTQQFLRAMLNQRKQVIDQVGKMLQPVLSEVLVNAELRQHYYQEVISPSLDLLADHLRARLQSEQIGTLEPGLVSRLLVGLFIGLYILQVLDDPLVNSEWDALCEAIVSIVFEGVAQKAEGHGSQESATP